MAASTLALASDAKGEVATWLWSRSFWMCGLLSAMGWWSTSFSGCCLRSAVVGQCLQQFAYEGSLVGEPLGHLAGEVQQADVGGIGDGGAVRCGSAWHSQLTEGRLDAGKPELSDAAKRRYDTRVVTLQ